MSAATTGCNPAARGGGGDEQRPARLLRQRRHAQQKGRGERVTDRNGTQHGLRARALSVAQRTRSLDQRQRIAGAVREQELDHSRRQRPVLGGEQTTAGDLVERLDRERGQAAAVELERRTGTRGDQHGDAFHAQAASRKAQRVRARLVEPLRVVDDDQQRRGGGRRGQQRQDRGTDGEPVNRRGIRARQGSVERAGLRRRQRRHARELRSTQRSEPGERQVRLALDAGDREHAHAGGLLGGPRTQRALADSRLPAHHQNAAALLARCGQQLRDPRAFVFAPHQR